jgi:biotin carboxyl carrier protein
MENGRTRRVAPIQALAIGVTRQTFSVTGLSVKLKAEIEGETQSIEIKRDGTQVFAEIDGRRYTLEARESQPGVYLLLSDGHVYECRVAQREAKRESLEVTIGTRAFSVILTDPKRLRGAQASGSHTDGISEIVAPMPGKVVRVLVETGAEVEAGAGLIIVEAMKMQNEMKAPKAGKVTSINVTTGTTVNAGDVLAVVE